MSSAMPRDMPVASRMTSINRSILCCFFSFGTYLKENLLATRWASESISSDGSTMESQLAGGQTRLEGDVYLKGYGDQDLGFPPTICTRQARKGATEQVVYGK